MKTFFLQNCLFKQKSPFWPIRFIPEVVKIASFFVSFLFYGQPEVLDNEFYAPLCFCSALLRIRKLFLNICTYCTFPVTYYQIKINGRLFLRIDIVTQQYPIIGCTISLFMHFQPFLNSSCCQLSLFQWKLLKWFIDLAPDFYIYIPSKNKRILVWL